MVLINTRGGGCRLSKLMLPVADFGLRSEAASRVLCLDPSMQSEDERSGKHISNLV